MIPTVSSSSYCSSRNSSTLPNPVLAHHYKSSSMSSLCSTMTANDDSNLKLNTAEISLEDTSESNDTKRVKKSVSFVPFVQVYEVELHPRYLKDQLWYSGYDYQNIKRRNAQEIKDVKQSGMNILFRPHHYRGLERLLDENRTHNRFRSIQAVLMEQDRQRLVYARDFDAMADLYHAYCISSLNKAQRLAEMDAQDAQLAMTETWSSTVDGDSQRSIDSTYDHPTTTSINDSLRVFQMQRRNYRSRTVRSQAIEHIGLELESESDDVSSSSSSLHRHTSLWRNFFVPIIHAR
ncbi:hypothetical protein IV203_025122 [Nitzschia inconspicua]|uniref:Uncharacterized protein n=1 Tax=Nitzschia inconspicua TaxID=303405 RepID=A0A9K3PZU6_9STRA|nr:hypothetical protein IV203_002615 [Nitzschia inconspicua]KAG7359356.1 hypothetical protein IV203_034454 [Nitzschia inconspicua]KAG7365681.1 hypothetical protein IV203_025122 [Nitzschia inconspicua]